MTKQTQSRALTKSKQSEFESYLNLLCITEKLDDRIDRLKIADYECTEMQDIRLVKRVLKTAEYARSCAEEAMEFLDLHGFLYLSSIDRLVEAIDKSNEDYNLARNRFLEILIEMGEEIDFEIPKDLKLEEN